MPVAPRKGGTYSGVKCATFSGPPGAHRWFPGDPKEPPKGLGKGGRQHQGVPGGRWDVAGGSLGGPQERARGARGSWARSYKLLDL